MLLKLRFFRTIYSWFLSITGFSSGLEKFSLRSSQYLPCFLLLLSLLGLKATPLPAEEPMAEEQHLSLTEYDKLIEPSDREHWSFVPVHKPPFPEVSNPDWAKHPIDRFILAELDKKQWRPAPAAEPSAWLRRVYLDLTGIPPTVAEQDAFAADFSPSAREQLVNELLSRSTYGERWARHWLDVVRYSDSNGYERDAAKPSVWRYRDWVIRSLNEDKPYDRFVLEQLAGDELPNRSADTLIATGYYRLGPWDDEPADPTEDRFDQLDDLIGTTSQVFLGLTLSCASCHNHKFEPLTMHDYYRMAAIFSPLNRPRNGRTELDLPAGSHAELATLAERDRKILELNNSLISVRTEFRRDFLNSDKSKLPADVVAALLLPNDQRTAAQNQLALEHEKTLAEEITAALKESKPEKIQSLEKKIERLRVEVPDLPRGYFLHEPSPVAPKTHLLIRGKATRPGPEVQPGIPLVLAEKQPDFLLPDEFTSRRRLTLAHWITDKNNPLTPRVIVNRVWQHHFGKGLVATPNDFGIMGSPPTHPELLDYLAAWFVENGWSLKKLHRLILSSNTYAMSKQWNEQYGAADPENDRYWRFPRSRLEVEAIHDSILAAAGTLNPEMGGPGMFPPVPKAALEGHSDPNIVWTPSDESEASRRGIYIFVKRSLIVPMLEVLDFCDPNRSAPQRIITSVAPQALTLFNGEFVNRQAEHFADRLLKEAGENPTAQITLAYRLTLCRVPTEEELAELMQFLSRETQQRLELSRTEKKELSPQAAQHAALTQMCRVLFNLNEFVYTD